MTNLPQIFFRPINDEVNLIIFNCNSFYTQAHPSGTGHQLVLISDWTQGGHIPLGVAKDLKNAVEYIKSLDSKYLLQVA